MFSFLIRKNRELERIIHFMELDASNNYKDEAQKGFRALEGCFAELKNSGKLSEKQIGYYEGIIAKYEAEMKNFRH